MMLENIRQRRLSNGLNVISLAKGGAPVVSIQVWYMTGSANEREGIRGISHFLEHLMFRGSRNIPSEEHARRINEAGGHCNAFTAEDVTACINSVPREYLAMVLDMEADRMENLTIEPTLLETERKVIVEEYHTHMNNPVEKAFLEFRREIYRDHPYAHSPLGTLDDIHAVSAEECRRYYRTWYRPDNAVLVIVGDLPGDVWSMVEQAFGGIPGNGIEAPRTIPACPWTVPGPTFVRKGIDFDVPLLIQGYPAPASSSPDALALDMLQIIVSQGETSRIHREVVRRRSLAVMAGGMNHFLRLSGMSLFFAIFTPDISVTRVAAGIIGQIDTALRDGIREKEMEKVRNMTLANRHFELFSAEHICQKIGYAETVEGGYRRWVERLDHLRELTADELVEAGRANWTEASRYSLHLKPRRSNPLMFAMGLARRIMPNR